MNPGIETAGPEDAEALASLHRLSHKVSFAPFASDRWLAARDAWDYEGEWAAFLENARSNTRSCAWKAVAGVRVVGMVKVSAESVTEAQLTSMHVHPEHQRRGIGSALMRAAMDFMREAEFKTAILGVIQANHIARTLYEKSGWKVRELSADGTEGVPVATYEMSL